MRTSWIIVACLSLASGWLHAEPVTLQNPDFEAGAANDGVPVGWLRYGGGDPTSTLALVDDAASGKKAVRLLDTGPKVRDGKYATGVYQEFPCQPGWVYKAAVSAKCASRSADNAALVQLSFMPGGVWSSTNLTPPIGGGWQDFTVFAPTPPGATTLRLYLYTMHTENCDMTVDNVRLERFPAGLAKLRDMRLETALVQDGKPAAQIVLPEGKDYEALGKLVADATEKATGARLPIGGKLPDEQVNLVAIGNLLNNPVIKRLYWNHYVQIDSLKPGPGKFVIQTVQRPWPFPTRNVLVLGGSDLEGVTAAVKQFIALLPANQKTLKFGHILKTDAAAPLSAEAKQKLLTPSKDPSFVLFHRYAAQYQATGDDAYVQAAKLALDQLIELEAKEPRRHLTWPEETTSKQIFPAWDLIEESPVFTDEERLKYSRFLLGKLHDLTTHVYEWTRLDTTKDITWNHITFPLMGVYYGARYFKQHYGNVDGAMDTYLAKVHNTFKQQEDCFMPREDSAGYLTITPCHFAEYSLAEDRMTYFTNGNAAKMADMVIACTDNRGYFTAFGDHPNLETRDSRFLTYAFYHYRDGRYLWAMNLMHDGKWPNPYWQDVPPVEPKDFVGVRTVELPKRLYQFTIERGTYGIQDKDIAVPPERAFNKVQFRESWARDGQYMLLDGFGRGYHFHYDANAIVGLRQEAEDLLVDNDYLVRNTTEHCMVSVIHDGRADQHQPPCASLDFAVDLDTLGLTASTVPNYNGADWTRTIFWKKGSHFVVFDTLKAVAPGDYSFHCTWKVLDKNRERVDGSDYVITRPGMTLNRPGGLSLLSPRNASGGRAVRFGSSDAYLAFELNLDAGEYAVNLFGYGEHGGNDSFWLSMDGAQVGAHHVPLETIGPSGGDWEQKTPAPNLRVLKSGKHLFQVTLREAPGTVLDKLVIAKPGGQPLTLEAEDILARNLVIEPPSKFEFRIANADGSKLRVSKRVSANLLPVAKLHQIKSAPMKAADEDSFQNLLYVSKTDSPRKLTLKRLDTHTALVEGDALLAVAGKAGCKIPGGETDAKACYVGADALALAACTSFKLGAASLTSAKPVSLELGLKSGKLRVASAEATSITLPPNVIPVPAGGGTFDVRPESVQMLSHGLQQALQLATKQVAPSETRFLEENGFLRRLTPLLKLSDLGGEVYVALPADLNNDGKPELLLGVGNHCLCLDGAGKELWRVETLAPVKALFAYDLDKDGKLEVICGSNDEHVRILSAAGKLIRQWKVDAKIVSGQGHESRPLVNTL
ncbi:MAG: VCBS repeat-containing protein, partial [Planctomycetes bacterium]|nr:VCBS repeat-containing protein [Planctomycetota bacterium]